eukprot:Gregarina_sp_Poly_1__11086@NODE_893_length_5825_cov_380_458666_g637_i0_p3_GENE_NODE_893_length_5825_cov_380_458666_g637_i0NODE_893_length_5825_cov_380_458666_g637_i0_p3_ORF_typecomplete_len161_score13_50GFA/PF04828_14/5e03GFA/PF04828_14/2_7e20VacA2/PF03077_14/0_17_NODE_893_length_5825_cov_380_458666_g637_i044064888
MQLKGSCHCGAVRFSLESLHPYPYQLCYCGICRKTQGGGGYAINLGGDSASLKVEGTEKITVYRARLDNNKTSTGERNFCSVCGSGLWLYDPTWPELIHPFASAIDTPLPVPPEHTHLMLCSKQSWVEVHKNDKDLCFDEYPKESIAEWHQRLNLECPNH